MDALRAFEDLARRRALDEYRYDVLLYTLNAPHVAKGKRGKPPKPPAILRDTD